MPSETTILAFDTSAAHCAAALLRGGNIIDARTEAMTRGQAERLMPFLENLLCDHNCIWMDLSAIGVGVGPGNFTGIRISVSAARGLALGLEIPAVGVTGFDALARLAPHDTTPAISAPRDHVYVRTNADEPPRLVPRTEAPAGKPLFTCNNPRAFASAIAEVAAQRWTTTQTPPSPYYVRSADAAPSRDKPPVLLDE